MTARDRTTRAIERATRVVAGLILALVYAYLTGCAHVPAVPYDGWPGAEHGDWDDQYNAAGGYIPACDELPGIIGDDC